MLLRASTALPEKFPQTNLGVYGVTVPLHNDNSYGVMCSFLLLYGIRPGPLGMLGSHSLAQQQPRLRSVCFSRPSTLGNLACVTLLR